MKLIKFLFFVIVALVISNVTLTNRAVDDSVLVSTLNKEIATIQKENTILRGQVALAGSINALSQKIKEAGFEQSPKVVSLKSQTSIASR